MKVKTVKGSLVAGALVFTAIGPGHYAFVHTANGETLTAEFDLTADGRDAPAPRRGGARVETPEAQGRRG